MPAFTLPRHRWVVERSFARIGRLRGTIKDYKYLLESIEAMINLTVIRTTLGRLARGEHMECRVRKDLD